MAEAAISFTVEKMGEILIQKVELLQGVEEEVKSLKAELKRMQCFLKDASEKQANDERIRHWISEIRDTAHDAEDVIDTFVMKVDAPRRSSGLLRRWVCFPTSIYNVNRIGEKIKRIQSNLKAIDQSRVRYGIQDLGEGTSFAPQRLEIPHWQKDKQVVGLTKDVELLVSKAVQKGKKGLTFAGIVGMGGIGKSTLARMVYNHQKVVDRFDRRCWVVVSGEFRPKQVIKDLVQQLLRGSEDELKMLKTMEKSEMPRLQEMLHERLKGKRYLIVLDDVWDSNHWESLAAAFPVEDKGSVLLLTSRTQVILNGRGAYVHTMKKLDKMESWELFLNKSFIGNTYTVKCPKDLKKKIEKEILKKCDGLPLAITVVGGQVAKLGPRPTSELEIFLKPLSIQLGRRECSVKTILELSYNNLPAQLKACFLCLAFFKEDDPIRAKRLMHIWIAQGLVTQEGREDQTVEEIARGYLHELINRNLIRVDETGAGNRVKRFHVHDLLRELSIEKANEEISFETQRLGAEGSSRLLGKPRHRAIYCSGESLVISDSSSRNKRVRSLYFHGSAVSRVDVGRSYWKNLELLRVLDFEDLGLRKLPDSIGSLIGLRFLGLRNNKLQELPGSLGHLKSLQFLDIARNDLHIQVPNVIWKMKSLRHLYMSRIKCNVPLKIHSLNHLQTVAYIPISNWLPKNLKKMTGLHKLGIELEDAGSDLMKLCNSLTMLQNLTCLNLRWYGFKSMESLDKLSILHHLTHLKVRGALNELPSQSYFPPNLSCLSLVGNWLSEDPMPTLERLPKLGYLKLDCAYNGKKMKISSDGFPSLEVLCLFGLSELEKIRVESGGMSKIKVLEISGCPHLKTLPSHLRSISNL